MLADRSHHVHSVIEPTLASGRAVVSDRYYASTLAYQGYGRGVDLDLLQSASELAIGNCRADATILLDIPLAVVNERRAHDQKDRFESADLTFHERVREGYLELAEALQWIVIDGTQPIDEVAREIDKRVAHLPW